MQIYSLATAWVLFEKLIQMNIVRKHNRRAYLGTCILISLKQVQIYGGYYDNDFNQAIFDQVNKDILRLLLNQKPEKPITTYERVILQTLKFHIRPPFFLIIKHMLSILTMIDKQLQDILDP